MPISCQQFLLASRDKPSVQKMEERYNLLAEEKGSEAAANKKLALELESAEQVASSLLLQCR